MCTPRFSSKIPLVPAEAAVGVNHHRRNYMKLPVPSPALVLSLGALFVAIGGGAAIAAGLSGSKPQVKHLISGFLG